MGDRGLVTAGLRGLAIRPWRASDLESVVSLWNAAFPRRRLDRDRFDRQMCQSPWCDPSGGLVATRHARVVGCLLVSARRAADGTPDTSGHGFLEWLVMDPQCTGSAVGPALVAEALRYSRHHQFSVVRADGWRVPCDAQGHAVVGAEVTALQRAGFILRELGQELAMACARWDRAITRRWVSRLRAQGIEIRVASPRDRDRVEAALQRWHGPRDRQCARFRRGEPLETFVIASRGEAVLGYCRWALVDGTTAYDRDASVWVATTAPGTGHVYNLYVDPAHRALGMGAALVAHAFDTLMDRGGLVLEGWTASPALQARYRRWGFRPIGGVVFLTTTRMSCGAGCPAA